MRVCQWSSKFYYNTHLLNFICNIASCVRSFICNIASCVRSFICNIASCVRSFICNIASCVRSFICNIASCRPKFYLQYCQLRPKFYLQYCQLRPKFYLRIRLDFSLEMHFHLRSTVRSYFAQKPRTLIKSQLEIERKLSKSKTTYLARVLIECLALNFSAYNT